MPITDLYQAHASAIRHYLARFVSKAEAEDLTQEVFIKAGQGLKDFRGESSPKTWLYRIATNALCDFLKSKAYRRTQVQAGISEPELERYDDAPGQDAPLEKGAIHDEMNECIREFIHRLPELYSSVLVLGELEGYRHREIAEILDISVESVKVRLHRARARLKEELSRGCTLSYSSDNRLECERRHRPDGSGKTDPPTADRKDPR